MHGNYTHRIFSILILGLAIRVGTGAPVIRSAAEPDYPPLSGVNASGPAEGFGVAMLRAAVHEMGREVHFSVDSRVTLQDQLAAGQLDVLPLVGRTPQREQQLSAIALLIAVLALGCIALLHRQVRKRTAALLNANRELETTQAQALKLMNDAVQSRQQLEQLLNKAKQSRRALLSVLDDEKRLAADRMRLVTAIEQTDEVLIMTDPDGTIIYTNPAFYDATGYTCEEALGQNPRMLKSGKQSASFYEALWGTLTQGKVWRGRMINRRKDGTFYEEDATISPVVDSAWKTTGYVALKRDITHEVALQQRLHQVQKMESIGILAGGVAHDFNNLIMATMGYTELCQDEVDPNHPIREYLDEIMDAMRRSADITRQLLAFARKQTIAPKVLDLNDTIASMLKLLRRLIGEDIQLTFHPGSDLRKITMDPSLVDQLLANLCVNSRDAIVNAGEIIIETNNITLEAGLIDADADPDLRPGEYVVLTVSDSGCGMDRDTLAKIFEPFFTTKGSGRGTGLGMATVYGIVKQSNGFILADSEPGNGTTFTLYFPAVQVVSSSDHDDRDGRMSPPGNGETILLVEDEKSLRATCTRFLEALGYHVLAAGTPGAALRQAEACGHTIDVLLTDVVMPGMNGQQLAATLSRTIPRLKVLFMSGYTADVIAQRGVLADGIDFIAKPFSRDDLARKLADILDRD